MQRLVALLFLVALVFAQTVKPNENYESISIAGSSFYAFSSISGSFSTFVEYVSDSWNGASSAAITDSFTTWTSWETPDAFYSDSNPQTSVGFSPISISGSPFSASLSSQNEYSSISVSRSSFLAKDADYSPISMSIMSPFPAEDVDYSSISPISVSMHPYSSSPISISNSPFAAENVDDSPVSISLTSMSPNSASSTSRGRLFGGWFGWIWSWF